MNDVIENKSVKNRLENLGPLVFLMSFFIVLSGLGPFFILAPVPAISAILTYGFGVVLAALVPLYSVLGFIVWKNPAISGIISVSLVCFFAASLIILVIKKNIRPDRALYFIGPMICIAIFGYLFSQGITSPQKLHNEIVTNTQKLVQIINANSKNKDDLKGQELLLTHPDKFANEVFKLVPAILLGSSMLWSWLLLTMTLKIGRLRTLFLGYAFDMRDLVNFRVPDFFVFPLIFFAALAALISFGIMGKNLEVWAWNLFIPFSFFYLVQGFGVYSRFLTFVGIRSSLSNHLIARVFNLRHLLIFMTLSWGAEYLMFVGIFDYWFDFRKYFSKKIENKTKV